MANLAIELLEPRIVPQWREQRIAVGEIPPTVYLTVRHAVLQLAQRTLVVTQHHECSRALTTEPVRRPAQTVRIDHRQRALRQRLSLLTLAGEHHRMRIDQ